MGYCAQQLDLVAVDDHELDERRRFKFGFAELNFLLTNEIIQLPKLYFVHSEILEVSSK